MLLRIIVVKILFSIEWKAYKSTQNDKEIFSKNEIKIDSLVNFGPMFSGSK